MLRIDEIDPDRQPAGAVDNILLFLLESLGLHWDRSVIFQSQRYSDYLDVCAQLIKADRVYPCHCSRKKLHQYPDYPEFCRTLLNKDEKQNLIFQDALQGAVQSHGNLSDIVIFRKESLPSYMLACAFDDSHDGITHIVRGCNLLESTIPRIYLQKLLQQIVSHYAQTRLPEYAYIPVITNSLGQKLSKQSLAPEINTQQASGLIFKALHALGQQPPPDIAGTSSTELLQWSIEHWNLNNIPKRESIALNEIPRTRFECMFENPGQGRIIMFHHLSFF